jgi:phage gp29-like protein
MASGNADSFMVMVNWSEGSVSKAILGGTLTSSTAANGNRSLGDVHNEVRLDIRDDDAGQVDETLSGQLVYPMAMLNGLFADNRCPRWVSDTQEPDDLALFADAIPKLVAVGVQVPKNYVNTKLKIPLPEDGEAVLGAVMPAVTPPATGLTALAGQVPANTYVDPTPVSSQSNQLAVYADPAIQDWLAVIQDKLNKAESLAAFKEDLLTSYGDLETEKLIKVMGLGFAAADLAGRFDVNEGG